MEENMVDTLNTSVNPNKSLRMNMNKCGLLRRRGKGNLLENLLSSNRLSKWIKKRVL
jgi:hypothetical protein